MAKMVSLEASNIKRLKAIKIVPDPEQNTLVIGGRNDQGKSTALDCILYALGGQRVIPSEPLRQGTKKGEILLELAKALDDGNIIIKRTFTKKGSALVVKPKEGNFQYTSPQQILNGIFDPNILDPMEFIGMEPKAQRDFLADLVGLDLDDLDEEYNEVYAKRRSVRQEHKIRKADLERMPFHPEMMGIAPVDVEELLEEQKSWLAHNEQAKDDERKLMDARVKISQTKDRIAAYEKQITTLREKLEDLELFVEGIKQAGLQPYDTGQIDEQILRATAKNGMIEANRSWEKVANECEAMEDSIQRLSTKLNVILEEKAKRLAEAEFPVEGLSFDEERVLFKGVPFNQCGSAVKYRVSCELGLSKNPELRILLIKDGSLLDNENLALIEQLAEKYDALILIERVGTGPEVSVIIEDGESRPRESIWDGAKTVKEHQAAGGYNQKGGDENA